MYIDFNGHSFEWYGGSLYPLLDEMTTLDPDVYYWCKYRFRIYGELVGSEQSNLLRANLHNLIAAIYSHWETIEEALPPDLIRKIIEQMDSIISISRDYPVVLWQYTDTKENNSWVKDTMSKLPSLEEMLLYFSLPHMRQRAVETHTWEGKGSKEYAADKLRKKALADFNKRRKNRRNQI